MNTIKNSKWAQFFCLFLIIPFLINGQSNKKNSFYIANWNVENLFDTMDDTLKNDNEFLPGSEKVWNMKKFEEKLRNLSKVIRYMNDGKGPDILAFEEVENINVLKFLIYELPFRDYVICHRDSPDERGIDVALIYDRKVFSIDDLNAIHVELPDKTPTRDILHVVLLHGKTKNKIHLYVNHWPSRRGGEEQSGAKRNSAAETLKKNLDSLELAVPISNIVILGDFNDEPTNESITSVLGAKDFDCANPLTGSNNLFNLAYKKYENGEGSYLYRNKWNMLDQIILSASLLDKKGMEYDCDSFQIIKPPFMIDPQNKYGGPLSTYRGNKYLGGYSDHFPVGAKFYVKGK